MIDTKPSLPIRARSIATIAAFLCVLPLLASNHQWWHQFGPTIFPSGSVTVLSALLLIALTMLLSKSATKPLRALLTGEFLHLPTLFFCLFIYSGLSWMNRPFSLFQGPSIRGELLLLGIGMAAVIRNSPRNLGIYALITTLTIIATFFVESSGRQIIGDDAATFFYRLSLLKEQFPAIPFYNPLWNAGIDERAFFATGSLNLFLLFSPLIYLFPVESLFNWIFSSITFIGLPLGAVSSMVIFRKNLQKTSEESWALYGIVALLALVPSVLWYKWTITFGTLGFATTCLFLLPNVTLATLFLTRDRDLSAAEVLGAGISFTLMLLWSPSGLVFIPLIIYCLATIRRQLKKKRLWLLAALLILLNGPWIFAFWHVSKVSRFLGDDATVPKVTEEVTVSEKSRMTPPLQSKVTTTSRKYKHRKGKADLGEALQIHRQQSNQVNPLLFPMGIFGLFYLPTLFRRWYGATILWAAGLGTVAVPLVPQLELDRMLLLAHLLLILPSGLLLYRFFKDYFFSQNVDPETSPANVVNRAFTRWIPAVACCSFLAAGPLVVLSIIKNRSPEKLRFKDSQVEELIEFLSTRKPEDGRTLFAGCSTHDLNGGHLAPLTVYSGTPLMASSQVGDIWRYTDSMPARFAQKGLKGRLEYMDLYNIGGVLAQERDHISFMKQHPQVFQETWSNGQYAYFQRTGFQPNYFLQGSGAITTQDHHSVTLNLDAQPAVVKFHYFPFLQASGGCRVEPAPIDDEITFVKISGCNSLQEIKLDSVALTERLAKEYS